MKERFRQGGGVDFNHVAFAAEIIHHLPDKIAVAVGLEFGGLKIFPVVLVIDREGPEAFSPFFQHAGGHRRNQTGIQSARKESADGNVGDKLTGDRVGDEITHMFGSLLEGFGVLAILQVPVAVNAQSVLVVKAAVGGFQFLHALEYTVAGGSAGTDQHDFHHALRVNFGLAVGLCQNALDFGGKDKPIVVDGIKEGFHADSVTGKEQAAFLFVPDGKGKNAVELVDAVRTEYRKGVQHHLGVGMPREFAAVFQQPAAHFGGVVQFAVVDNDIAVSVVHAAHGLSPVFDVHHAKARMYQHRLVAHVNAVLVGAAPLHCVLRRVGAFACHTAGGTNFSCDSAHDDQLLYCIKYAVLQFQNMIFCAFGARFIRHCIGKIWRPLGE